MPPILPLEQQRPISGDILLKLGHHIRFTEVERRKHDHVGIDLTEVRTIDQYSRAIEVWALCMAEAYPDLLKKFVRQLEQNVAARSSPPSPTETMADSHRAEDWQPENTGTGPQHPQGD